MVILKKIEGYFSFSKNTGVCCHALLQGIFLTQGSPAFQADFLSSEPPEKPIVFTKNTEINQWNPIEGPEIDIGTNIVNRSDNI